MSPVRLFILAAGWALLVQLPVGFAQIQQKGTTEAFITNALRASQFQVDLGRVATVRGGRSRTKAFAQLMIDDHSKIDARLEALAKQKGIKIPAREPMPIKLIGLKGKAFDHDYAIMMVEEHEKALTAFQKEAQSGTDPEVRQFAAKTAPTLLTNLDLARRLKL